MIHAIYLMARTGLPIAYVEGLELQNENITKATLFSGALTAIQSLMKEMAVGQATEIETKSSEILFEMGDSFAVAVVLEKNSENKDRIREKMEELITEITFKFGLDTENHIQDLTKQQQIQKLLAEKLSQWEEAEKETKIVKKMKEILW